MKRIKLFGLAAAAALALTATIGAASASASWFITPVAGSITGTEGLTMIIDNRETRCEPIEFGGEALDPTGTLTSIVPKSSVACESKIFGGWEKTTLEMNGCTLSLHAGAETEAAHFGGTMDIEPTGCGPIKLHRFSCDVTIPSQTGLGGVKFFNNSAATPDTVEATLTVSATAEGNGGFCGKKPTLSFLGTWNEEAFEEGSGVPINLHVSPVGVFTGAGGFESAAYPNTVIGKQTSKHVLPLQAGRKVECSTVQFESLLTSATSNMSASMSYGGCATKPVFGISYPATVKANSCSYVFHTAGTMDVSCSKEGDAIEFVLYQNAEEQEKNKPLCVAKVGPQSGLKTVEFANVGEKNEGVITAKFGVAGLVYSTGGEYFVCGSKGTYETTYSGSSTFTGS